VKVKLNASNASQTRMERRTGNMSAHITTWILSSFIMLIGGCTSLPRYAPTSTVSQAEAASTWPLITVTFSRQELSVSPEPALIQTSSPSPSTPPTETLSVSPESVLIQTPSPSSSLPQTVSFSWEPAGIFFEEEGSIYHARFDGSNRQLIIPGERLISVSPDGFWVISSDDSGVHLISSAGEKVGLPTAFADAYFWSPDSSALILQRNLGNPQEDGEYERWSLTPVGLERRFQIDGELVPLGIGSQGNLLLETLNASDYDSGPLDYTPGYYTYDDRYKQLDQIEVIDLSIRPIAPGGRRRAVLSPRGDKMAVSFDGINLWILDLQSRVLTRKTMFGIDPYPGGVGRITWSPQETSLAFEQFEIYHRDTGYWENRVAVLDLQSNESVIFSDEAIIGRAGLPSDFPIDQSFFKPAGWDGSGNDLFIYFEVTTLEGTFGHRDHPDYPGIGRVHQFWRLDLDTISIDPVPWLEDVHAIFPRYSSAD
jgi:hypothetical protein